MVEWILKQIAWINSHQVTTFWIVVGIIGVILLLVFSGRKAREGLAAFARLVLQYIWVVIFIFTGLCVVPALLIVVVWGVQRVGPTTINAVDRISNGQQVVTVDDSGNSVPGATPGAQTVTNPEVTFAAGTYTVAPGGAFVRSMADSNASQLGTLPAGSTVTIATPTDSNCVANGNGKQVCQRAQITSFTLPEGVTPELLGFNPVGGYIHLAAVNP